MNVAQIIEKVARDGVILTLSPVGTITATGDEPAVDRWLPTIRDNKSGILRELQREGRRAKVLATLEADPALRYAVHVDDASTDPVVVVVGIRSVASFELEIPSRYYDALALLELIEKHVGEQLEST